MWSAAFAFLRSQLFGPVAWRFLIPPACGWCRLDWATEGPDQPMLPETAYAMQQVEFALELTLV